MTGKEGWVELDQARASAWDDFVEAHPHGRISHLLGFKKTVETIYGLRPNYWLYRRQGKILATFPSFFHRSLIYGKRLVSQPFSEYGGLLFAPGLASREKAALLEEFPRLIEESQKNEKFDYLELRHFAEAAGLEGPLVRSLFKKESLYASGILRLDQNLDLWRGVDPSVRKNLKRARRCGLRLEEGKGREAIENVFYPLHLRTLRRLGSPPHPLDYFLSQHKNLKNRMKLFLAYLGDVCVSALLGWTVGQSVHITDIVSDERFFAVRANDFLHFELITWAIGAGFRTFDFGPIRYPGQRQYKRKWGVELREYACYYFPPEKSRPPLSDRSMPARLASGCWKIFIPSGLAPRIGKYLRKELAL